MLTLGINTASSHSSFVLIKEGKLIAGEQWVSKNDEAEKLMPLIDKTLRSQNLTYQDLTKIAVITGPGSFTGLRVGLTVANTLAHLLKIPILPITTFQYWHTIHNQESLANDEIQEVEERPKEMYEPIRRGGRDEDDKVDRICNRILPILVFAGRGAVYYSPSIDAEPQILNITEAQKIFQKDEMQGNNERPPEAYNNIQRQGSEEVDAADRLLGNLPKAAGDITEDQIAALQINFTTSTDWLADFLKVINETKTPQTTFAQPLYVKAPEITQSKK